MFTGDLKAIWLTDLDYYRPDLFAPALNVTTQETDLENGYQAGYIFMCPYRANQTGPYIFDKAGWVLAKV